MEAKKQHRTFREKLLNKYRLVFINEDSLEETVSIKLHRLGVWITFTLCMTLLIVLTTLLIVYTPLRQYVLGFSEVELRKEIVALSFQIDSLQEKLHQNDKFFDNIQKILRGDVSTEKTDRDPKGETTTHEKIEEIKPNSADSLLRQAVAEEDRFSIFNKAEKKQKITVFFPPVDGVISSAFDVSQKHFGVDISSDKDTPVKAIADGTVIFSEWTVEHGYVMIIEHQLGFTSVYKHLYLPNKKQGDNVKAGEAIASLIFKEEFETNPYLHFELWENTYPVDPKNYIQLK